jgi:hypothetical protein
MPCIGVGEIIRYRSGDCVTPCDGGAGVGEGERTWVVGGTEDTGWGDREWFRFGNGVGGGEGEEEEAE